MQTPGWHPILCVGSCLIWLFSSFKKKYGHTWHRISLLRPGVIKQRKPNQSTYLYSTLTLPACPLTPKLIHPQMASDISWCILSLPTYLPTSLSLSPPLLWINLDVLCAKCMFCARTHALCILCMHELMLCAFCACSLKKKEKRKKKSAMCTEH